MFRPLFLVFLQGLMAGGLSVDAQSTRAAPFHGSFVARNIDVVNGLLSNNVLSIAQDRKGFVWIGTDKGMQRYDGLRFVSCSAPGTAPNALDVPAIYPDDAQGRILYRRADDSLWQWDPLRHTAAPVATPSVSSKDLVYTDPQGKRLTIRPVWKDGDAPQKNGLVLVHEEGGGRDKPGTYLTDSARGQAWLLIRGGGFQLLDETRRTTVAAPLPVDPITIHSIFTDRNDNLWLISWSKEFYRYELRTHKLHTYSLAHILTQEGNDSTLPVWISSVLHDNHGVLWLATGQAGLLQYDQTSDSFIYILRQTGNNLGLQYTDQINTMFQDKEENIWLGTDKGISIIHPYRQYFSVLSNQEAATPSKIVSDIIPVQLIKGQLWVGSWGGGIKVYDTAWRLRKHYFFPGLYDENMVWCFFENKDGTVWAGCQSGAIHIIDANGGLVKTLRPPELEHHTVKCITGDGQGNILIGLQNGWIVVYDKATGRFMRHIEDSAFRRTPVEHLYMGKDGICWTSTSRGLAAFDTHTRHYTGLYRPAAVDVRCWGVCPYRDSLLIVGTENSGMYYFNVRTKVFTRIQVNNEQQYWSAHAVKVDASGKIWFTDDHAICCYDPQSGNFFASQPERGLLNSSFQGQEFLAAPDGKWMTSTGTEVVAFYEQNLLARWQEAPTVAITGFRVFSHPLFIDSLLQEKQPVRLAPGQNFLDIEFSSLQFAGIEQAKFLYKLEGVDPGWVTGGSQGVASYTDLAPGKYTFRVRTESSSGEQGMAVMQVQIAAPFWNTWWFDALVLAAAALVIFLLLRWREKGMRNKERLKQQVAETEMMALRAQMNPHFIFNCINSIDALIQSNDKYHATVYLNKFARLIRNVLETSKQKTIPLMRDMESLQLYIDLEQFRDENRFVCEMVLDDELLEEDCRVPPLIIQPYVENAIVHGLRGREDGQGKLLIRVTKEDEHLVFLIEDNGVGRTAAVKKNGHRSFGMEMSRERVNLFNGEEYFPVVITDLFESGKAAGTRVQVSLKINS
ncbi:MAG: histidine kinase [Bacteroidetes bacterium]|nr:histidine kinase [Bacteroidota bacterium]